MLLHPTSLPSRFGIGDLGPAAFTFLEYLASARQSLWQVLPLGPTGFGDSPYSSPSAFAGNPLLIALEPLMADGLIRESELDELAELPRDHVDFGQLAPLKRAALERAFHQVRPDLQARIGDFCERHSEWLADYALFAALHDEAQAPWTEWDASLRSRDPDALAGARQRLAERVAFHEFCQYVFFMQWSAVRRRANELGIHIVGDIPVFVAHDSADVWAHQPLFKLDDAGKPVVMAGVPPDYFSATGQLWGNPLYDWEAMAADGYAWWVARFRHLLEEVDVVRIDHFRGFEAAWEVPFGETTAVNGQWVTGPGAAVFEAIAAALGTSQAPVIAEDLGLITDSVRELLRATGFPGMKVLQFAFGGGAENPYLPHNYADANCVVYTGTHDNDTTRGWYTSLSNQEQAYVLRYLGAADSQSVRVSEALMRVALASTARIAIIPLQDVLDLGSDARINTPGAAEGNWAWRIRPDQLAPARAACLAELTTLYGRA